MTSFKAPARRAPTVNCIPISDRVWAANHKLAEDRELAQFVGSKNNKRAALALHEMALAVLDLRDVCDESGWNTVSRWLNQASLALNMAARMAWRIHHGGYPK